MTTVRENMLIGSVSILLSYSIFARAGTYTPWQPPLLGLSILTFFLLILVPQGFRKEASSYRKELCANLQPIAVDPLFYAGFAFLGLLVLQWTNSGRELIFDNELAEWMYSAPPRPGWPSSIMRFEATEMLNWFAPAFVLILTLRHGLPHWEARKRLLHILLGIAAVSAIFGTVQFYIGATKMYGFMEIGTFFFSTFGYPNHAAAFYVLTQALAIAFCQKELVRPFSSWDRWRILIYLLTTLILFAGAQLSLSRAGILLSSFVLVAAGVYFMASCWYGLNLSQRINLVVCSIAIAGIVIFIFLATNSGVKTYLAELGNLINISPQEEVDKRWFMAKAAWEMWQDHPWFGVGGWGFRYFIGMYMPEEKWDLIGTGKANVHNDPLQFLAEFGLIGFGLLSVITLWLLLPTLRHSLRAFHPLPPPFLLFTLTGLGCTLLHAQIDLPFRCPAVLYTWITIAICRVGPKI